MTLAGGESGTRRAGRHPGKRVPPLLHWAKVAASHDRLPPGWREHGRRQHLDLLDRWIGAPTGHWLKTDLFEERSRSRTLLPHLPTARWFAIDVAEPVAAQATGGNHLAVVADVRALPFRSRAFEGILSTSTLDHLPDRDSLDESIHELARVLVPGGALVLTLDNPDNPLIRLRAALPPRVTALTGLAPYGVGATLSRDEGRAALARAGLVVEVVEFLLHAPHIVGTRLARFSWYARRALPAFDRLARTRCARRTGHYVAFLARQPSTA